MREVLFRGKCKRNAWSDGGQWLYGDYLRCGDRAQIWVYEDGDENNYEVDPDTVGEWTGLTDRNDRKIFEGDLVRYNGEIHKVVFEQRNGKAYFGWAADPLETWDFDREFLWRMEVVGNVYDNPELWEAKT